MNRKRRKVIVEERKKIRWNKRKKDEELHDGG